MKISYFLWVSFFNFLTILHASEPAKSGCLEKEKALALLETAEDLLSKAKIHLPFGKKEINATNSSECEGQKPLAYIEISKKLISNVRENFPTCEGSKVIIQFDKHRDCTEILASGHKENGVYTVWPSESNTTGKPLQVYCDMKTDGGGWTVIQRRGKFPVQQDFNQDWENYKYGFGNITQEFWLGNEHIRILCHTGCKIRFDLQHKDGEKGFAVYKYFSLSVSNYTININGYTGDAGDGMRYYDKFKFSRKDKGDTRLGEKFQGGWWHSNSNQCNLNGLYQSGKNSNQTVNWYLFRGFDNLATVEMKVKER